MKIIVAAIALALAFPAAAQTAPAQHQGHGQPAPPQHQPGQHQPGQHQGHEDGCCADRNNNGRMDCCERMAQAGEARGCCAEHAEHQAGHEGHR
jgi:hypothetical protein